MQKDHQLMGDFVPQTPYRGFAPGPHWGTEVPRPPECGVQKIPYIILWFNPTSVRVQPTPSHSHQLATCDGASYRNDLWTGRPVLSHEKKEKEYIWRYYEAICWRYQAHVDSVKHVYVRPRSTTPCVPCVCVNTDVQQRRCIHKGIRETEQTTVDALTQIQRQEHYLNRITDSAVWYFDISRLCILSLDRLHGALQNSLWFYVMLYRCFHLKPTPSSHPLWTKLELLILGTKSIRNVLTFSFPLPLFFSSSLFFYPTSFSGVPAVYPAMGFG